MATKNTSIQCLNQSFLNNSSREVSRVMSSGDFSGPDFAEIFDKTNKLFVEIELKCI
jgi:hypothetical protein